MRKYIIISLLALMLMGCVTAVEKQLYDVGYVITIVIANRHKDYDYWYKLVDIENGNDLGFYSNKRWSVGDTIHIGAMWGKISNSQDN